QHMNSSIFFKILFVMLFGYCYTSTLSAQNIKVRAELDSSSIKIGQQTKLTLSIQYKVNTDDRIKIQWPAIGDTLRKEIEVVGQSKIDTVIPDKDDPFTFLQTKTVYITSFDSGYWAVTPFKFVVNSDTAGIYTDALLLSVSTVEVDTTQAIKDIKNPYEINYSWIDWIKDHKLEVGGVLLGIILLCLIIWLILRSRKKQPPVVEEKVIRIPAHIIAFEKLEKLKNDKLWQEGKLKQYHIALTDIIREYIENRFKIPAMEQTTEEILSGFKSVAIDAESKEKLRQLLLLGDLVKFAKEQPLPTENEMSLTNAYDFINGTKREEEMIPPVNQAPTNNA
ncbi:MAG: hypothetical protein ABUT20_38280, partial [Bacteroidota bacterium]